MNEKQANALRKRVILMSDIHYCKDGWYGVTQQIKRERLCADLEKEYAKDPYDALLLLGDYSLDHWKHGGFYLTQGICETKAFVDQCLSRLAPDGVDLFMMPGNHEQYGEEAWEKMTGFKRSGHLICGPVLFILLDNYGADLDPTENFDGTYTGADVARIRELMAEYPDKKIILCAHWFSMERESEEFFRLVREEERILCLFCGHNHASRVVATGEEEGDKPLIFTGNYSYAGDKNVVRCLSGYREVIITETGISTKYIVPPHDYQIEKVKFSNEYAEQDEIEILF